MPAFDNAVNWAYSTVATAPSPATSGVSLVVASGGGALFPTASFNAWAWPPSVQPLASNAELVRVTNKSTDTFTITRAQEGSSAKSIAIGWQIAAGVSLKTLTDMQNSLNYAADGGASDSYAVTLAPVPTAYVTGQVVLFKANTANTGAATLNVNSLGAKTIKKNGNVDLADNDIVSGEVVAVVYDGTNFQMVSRSSNIVNADVSSAAAIAYSKLNLTGGILNADVNAAAAIAFSKLESVAWTDFSGTIATANWNNTSTQARWQKVDRIVFYEIALIGQVTGDITWTLPVTAASAAQQPIGNARYIQVAGSAYDGVARIVNSTTVKMETFDVTGSYPAAAVLSSTIPFSWASSASNALYSSGYYQSAT